MSDPLSIEALWRRLRLQQEAHGDYMRILAQLLNVLARTPFGTHAGRCEQALAEGGAEPIGVQNVLALGRHLLVVRLTFEHVPASNDLVARTTVRLLYREDRTRVDLDAAIPLAELEQRRCADLNVDRADIHRPPPAPWRLELLREPSDRPTLTPREALASAPVPEQAPAAGLRTAVISLRGKLARLEAKGHKLVECGSFEEVMAVVATLAQIFVTSTVRVVEARTD